MFQDEARFGLINKPKRCWAPKGVRPIVPSKMVREYTYLYGAFCPYDGTSDLLILPSMKKQSMIHFLQELSKRHPNEHILLLCDGAACHKNLLDIPKNITIETIPPYTPEVNPSENMWDEIRESYFYNVGFDSMDAIESKLIEASLFYEKNPELVQSITLWDWMNIN